jgi:uncharacterized membrane protein HdeD (DUF308 family)
MVTLAEEVHPMAVLTVTVYVIGANGVVMGVAQSVQLRYKGGDQSYETTSALTMGSMSTSVPANTGSGVGIMTEGNESTITLTLAVSKKHLYLSSPITVY